MLCGWVRRHSARGFGATAVCSTSIPKSVATSSCVRIVSKTARFLPHDVSDLLPLLSLLESLQDDAECGKNVPWESLYVLLLWLSLVALVPFALAGDDASSASDRIERVARYFLARPGKERDASSVLLGCLYRRRDVVRPLFSPFLTWAQDRMLVTKSPFEVGPVADPGDGYPPDAVCHCQKQRRSIRPTPYGCHTRASEHVRAMGEKKHARRSIPGQAHGPPCFAALGR